LTERSAIRILSVDDHPFLREGIAAIIANQPDMILVSQARTAAEAIQNHREFRPDVTLMDLRLPDLNGIDAMVTIRAETPEVRIIILTTFGGDAEIKSALHAGARGYLLKSMPPKELVDVIRYVHAGETYVPTAFTAQQEKPESAQPQDSRELGAMRRALNLFLRKKI
jgi:DNA-binding NarL/FixJ family response regulator